MSGLIWASIGTGAAGLGIFTWVLGVWPDWTYPKMSGAACLAAILVGMVLAIGLISAAAVMADRADRTPEPVDRTIPTCTGAASELPGHVVTIDVVTVTNRDRAGR